MFTVDLPRIALLPSTMKLLLFKISYKTRSKYVQIAKEHIAIACFGFGFADKLGKLSVLETSTSAKSDFSTIRLQLNPDLGKLFEYPTTTTTSQLHLPEAYQLTVTDKGIVTVEGQTAAGVFNGLQTLLSLVDGSDNARILPIVDILDAPRFQFRGLMLDVARNFFEKNDILKTLDAMAMYKMNKLHLHLTDDQGWRIEIPGLPELTKVNTGIARRDERFLSIKNYFVNYIYIY